MSNKKGGFRGNRNKSQAHKKNLENVDDDNPIVCAFKGYAKELDSKHDRYERIVKHSRDITIESKRIIFLLHTIDSKKNNAEKIISDAQKRLEALCHTHFLSIAKELEGLDPYQYARAYSPGLQEFVEAYTFCEFLSEKKLSSWEDLQKQFFYKVAEKENLKVDGAEEVKAADDVKSDEVEKAEEVKEEDTTKDEAPKDEAPKEETQMMPEETKVKEISCLIQPMEFILGLADVTGEVMRKCINSLGSGDIDACFASCRMLQSLYSGYLSLNVRHRDLYHKTQTMEQSVLKTEDVCYNVKIRGGEAAKWGTVGSFGKANFDEDEGFYG